ncbi:MAG: hypothetical protein EP343_12410 [Deltaproteobacteria bacterium]|nr:MAG: hypothetical protein EP343_12410 [Deltaproteobacteria bacterium]
MVKRSFASSWWTLLACAGMLFCLPTQSEAASKDKPVTRKAVGAKAATKSALDPRALLPANVRIVVTLSSFKNLSTAFQSTPLAQLLKEEEMQPLIRHVVRRMAGDALGYRARRYRKKSLWKRAQRVFKALTKFQLTQALDIFQGPHALVVANIPSGSTPLGLGAVLHVAQPAQAKALLSNLLDLLPLKKDSYTYLSTQVGVVRGLENELHYAFVGSWGFLTSTKGLMMQILERHGGKGKTLLQASGYQTFLQKTSSSRGVSLYVAVDRILQDLSAVMGPKRTFLLKLLGLNHWKSIALSLGIQQKRFVTQLHLSFQKKGTLRQINRLLALPAANASLLKHVPLFTTMAGLARIPWVSIYDDVMASFKKTQPRGYRRFQKYLERFERGILRMTVRQMLGAFGENMAGFAFGYRDGGLFPQYVHAFHLKDAKRIKQTLKQLLSLASVKLGKKSYRGVEWLYLRSGRAMYRALRMMPYSYRRMLRMFLHRYQRICFAFVGQRLFVTMSPQTLRTFIDAQKDKDAELAKLRASLQAQAKGAGAWLYVDARRTVARFYNTLLALTPFVGRMVYRMFRPLRGLGIHQLPRSRVITRHMKTGVFSNRVDATHSLWKLRTGMGLEMALMGRMFLGTMEQLFFQFRLPSYIRNISEFSKLKQQSATWEDKGLYTLAQRKWMDLSRSAVFRAIGLIAKKQANRFAKLNEARQKAILAKLAQLHKKQLAHMGTVKFKGDWAEHNGALRVVTSKAQGATLQLGRTDLSEYVFSFEVRNPTRGFTMHFNLPQGKTLSLPGRSTPSYRRYSRYNRYRKYRKYRKYRRYRRYRGSSWRRRYRKQTLTFGSRRFAKDRWVPVKIKAKAGKISYWFGLKHYVHRTSQRSGSLGFVIPAKGKFEIRNLNLKVPKSLDSGSKPYPSLRVMLDGSPSTVEVGDSAFFRLSLKNVGQQAAKKVQIQVQLSSHVTYVSASTKPVRVSSKWNVRTRILTLSPVDALEAGQSLRIQVAVTGKKPGSALATSFLRFAQSKGEIAVSTRIHVAGDATKTAKPAKR